MVHVRIKEMPTNEGASARTMRMCLPVICDTKCARHLRVMCFLIDIPKYIHKYLDSYLPTY